MRRLIVTTFLSLFLISGTGIAFADNHRSGGHDNGRREQSFNKTRPNGNKPNGNNPAPGKDQPTGGHRPENVGQPDHRPSFQPAAPVRNNVGAPKHYSHAYHYPTYMVHDNLGYMVSHITRGGSDVTVWQVDATTYAVRFRKGNHLFVQYLYPYDGRYGQRSTISVNWSPLAPWTLIPNINLNINL